MDKKLLAWICPRCNAKNKAKKTDKIKVRRCKKCNQKVIIEF